MKVSETARWFLAALSLVLLQAAAAQPENDLLGYWPFDEGAGPTACDQAGKNDIALIGNPIWVQNASGYCLLFNGTENRRVYGKLKSHRGYRGNVGQGTLSVWAQTVDGGVALTNDTARRANVISVGFPHASLLGVRRGRWCTSVYDGRNVQYIDGPPVTDGEWTHLAATWNEVFTRFYVNGREIREGGPYLRYDVPGSGVTSWTSSYLASHVPKWGQMFRGYVDDWKVFKRPLTQKEMAAEYERGKDKRELKAN